MKEKIQTDTDAYYNETGYHKDGYNDHGLNEEGEDKNGWYTCPNCHEGKNRNYKDTDFIWRDFYVINNEWVMVEALTFQDGDTWATENTNEKAWDLLLESLKGPLLDTPLNKLLKELVKNDEYNIEPFAYTWSEELQNDEIIPNPQDYDFNAYDGQGYGGHCIKCGYSI